MQLPAAAKQMDPVSQADGGLTSKPEQQDTAHVEDTVVPLHIHRLAVNETAPAGPSNPGTCSRTQVGQALCSCKQWSVKSACAGRPYAAACSGACMLHGPRHVQAVCRLRRRPCSPAVPRLQALHHLHGNRLLWAPNSACHEKHQLQLINSCRAPDARWHSPPPEVHQRGTFTIQPSCLAVHYLSSNMPSYALPKIAMLLGHSQVDQAPSRRSTCQASHASHHVHRPTAHSVVGSAAQQQGPICPCGGSPACRGPDPAAQGQPRLCLIKSCMGMRPTCGAEHSEEWRAAAGLHGMRRACRHCGSGLGRLSLSQIRDRKTAVLAQTAGRWSRPGFGRMIAVQGAHQWVRTG